MDVVVEPAIVVFEKGAAAAVCVVVVVDCKDAGIVVNKNALLLSVIFAPVIYKEVTEFGKYNFHWFILQKTNKYLKEKTCNKL